MSKFSDEMKKNRAGKMLHKKCGGEVYESWKEPPYCYDSNADTDEGPSCSEYAVMRCKKCGKEIFGDSQIDLYDDNGERIK